MTILRASSSIVAKSRFPEKGVTLLETILVMMIAAMIASFAIPQFQKSVDQKRADSAISTLRTVAECIKQYMIENGGSTPTGTFQKLKDNGCLDWATFEPTYNFPQPEDPLPVGRLAPIWATDKKSTRAVCGYNFYTITSNAVFCDYEKYGNGVCIPTTRTDRYRTVNFTATAVSGDY
jgi:prepilin-type N-terminal cleavage/methylation domain-containing protein